MKLDYISRHGDRLHLTDNKLFFLINVDGQTVAETSISSSVLGGVDGDTVTNIQAQPRSIVLDFRIKQGVNVEKAKREILKIIKLKQRGTLEWEQNERTVVISGLIESIDMPRWENGVFMQVTMHCEQPFWEDIEDVVQEINEFINLHYFTESPYDMLYFPEDGIPFGIYDTNRTKSFYNDGDVSVGIEITIRAFDTVTNPIIYDQNGDFFGIGYGDGDKKVVMQSGDTAVITTEKGHKTVKINGVSVFDKIKPHSKWIQLEAGQNRFAINSDDENISNMAFSLLYKQRYI